MSASSTPSRRGFNLGMVQNFGAQLFGSLAGPVVVVALATAISWRAAFFISGIPGLVIAVLIWLVVRERRTVWLGIPSDRLNGWREAREVAATRNVWLSALIACCMIGWYILLLTFLPLYCVNWLHVSATVMSLILASVGAAGALSAILVPALSDRIGRKPVMVSLCLSGVVAPLAALTLGSGAVMALFVFAGSFALGAFPLFMGVVPQESVAAPRAAQAIALVMAVGQIVGGFVGPTLAGVAADAFDLRSPLLIAGLLALAGGVAAVSPTETAPCRSGKR